jgi:hypothetical protein
MKIAVTAALLLVLIAAGREATAQSGSPRVYGPTGRLYGPTQAEYQYQRQYGHPSGSSGGLGTAYVNGYPGGGFGRHYHAGSYCYGGGPWLYPPVYVPPYYGGYYGSFGFAPTAALLNPISTELPIDQQAALQEWLRDERQQWTSPLETMPVESLPKRYVKRSTDAAKARSVRLQHEGDLHFQSLEFDAAGHDYQAALMAAQDRPDPYFRLGFIDLTRSDFTEAAQNFKLGLQLDPTWPQTGPPLDELIGERNLLPKTQIKQRILDWVQQDIRDPDRLFVLGVVLHFDNDGERAAELFATAARLGGMKQYLQAFLTLPASTEQVAVPVEKAGELPPPPQPPEEAVQPEQPAAGPPPQPPEAVQPQPPETVEPAPPVVPGPRTSIPRESGPSLPAPPGLLPPPAPT